MERYTVTIKPPGSSPGLQLLVPLTSSSALSILANQARRRASQHGVNIPEAGFVLHLNHDGPILDLEDELGHVVLHPREETVVITWLEQPASEVENSEVRTHPLCSILTGGHISVYTSYPRLKPTCWWLHPRASQGHRSRIRIPTFVSMDKFLHNNLPCY